MSLPQLSRTASRSLWMGLVVLVLVALVVGTRGGGSSHQTLQQRTTSIAAQVKCPVCQGETAAESNTVSSVAIRSQISSWLSQGWSRQRILNQLSSDYSAAILESPPARGANVFLWVFPPLVLVAGALGLVFLFRHWKSRSRGTARPEDHEMVSAALAGAWAPTTRSGGPSSSSVSADGSSGDRPRP